MSTFKFTVVIECNVTEFPHDRAIFSKLADRLVKLSVDLKENAPTLVSSADQYHGQILGKDGGKTGRWSYVRPKTTP